MKTTNVLMLTNKKNDCGQPFLKTPGDGFEPPLKEPESFVLPLDDPGLQYSPRLLLTKLF